MKDRIEKSIVLRATRERVWRAISEAERFGAWFGVEFEGEFKAGSWLAGVIAPTKVDPVVAKLQEPHAGTRFGLLVERLEPMSHFSFRWHPFAIDPGADYESEPTTLVSFDLTEVDGGVLLTITESGFNQLPEARQAQAYESNEGGWEHQTRLIEKYLESEMSKT